MTHRLWTRMLSRTAIALALAFALSCTASPALAATEKAKPAAAAKAKTKAKVKPAGKAKVAAAKSATKKHPSAAAKPPKGGKSANAAGKGAKPPGNKDAKAAKADAAAKSKDAKGGKDAKAAETAKADKEAKAGKSGTDVKAEKDAKTAKAPKPDKGKSKKGLSAKTAPVDPNEAMEEEVDEFESDAKEHERAATSPLLYVFVLFILGCVAGYLYMKKKQELKASGAASADFGSSHGEAFASNLSSLNADKGRGDRSQKGDGGIDMGGSGKKSSWMSSKFFTSLGARSKTGAKKATEPPSTPFSDTPLDLGMTKGARKNEQAMTRVATNASATPAPIGKQGRAAQGKPEAAAPQEPAPSAPVVSAASDDLMTHVGIVPSVPEPKSSSEPPPDEAPLSDADWIGWDRIDAEEFWYRIKKIDQEGIDNGDEAYVAALMQSGFRDRWHFERIKSAYRARFPAASDIQPMMNGMTRVAEEKAQATTAKLLQPIAGVSLALYARIVAARAELTPDDADGLYRMLASLDVSRAQYDEADQGWQARLADKSDSQAATMLQAEYAKHLAAAAPANPSLAVSAGAGGRSAAATGGGAASAEPCSFERYVEIREAQNCWSQQGRDIMAMLQETFQLTVADWSVIAQYWSERFLADASLVADDGVFTERYRAKFGYVKAG